MPSFAVKLSAIVSGHSDDPQANFDVPGWEIGDVEKFRDGDIARIRILAAKEMTVEAQDSEAAARDVVLDEAGSIRLSGWEIDGAEVILSKQSGVREILDLDYEGNTAVPQPSWV